MSSKKPINALEIDPDPNASGPQTVHATELSFNIHRAQFGSMQFP